MKIPAEPNAAQLVALVESREQAPLDLTPLRTETASLPTGDYSLRGLEEIVAIERKSRQDLAACIGRDRKRFDREVQRLLAYPVRALVVEATWEEIESGAWRGEVRPEAALGSPLGWIAAGLPVVMAGGRERAGKYVARLLFLAARRRWREARSLVGAALAPPPEATGKSANAAPSANGK
jgi:DNA excision repair protein ERCC-4